MNGNSSFSNYVTSASLALFLAPPRCLSVSNQEEIELPISLRANLRIMSYRNRWSERRFIGSILPLRFFFFSFLIFCNVANSRSLFRAVIAYGVINCLIKPRNVITIIIRNESLFSSSLFASVSGHLFTCLSTKLFP